jgi:hypothetical protein
MSNRRSGAKALAFVLGVALLLAESVEAEPVWTEGAADCATWLQARAHPGSKITAEALLIGTLDGLALGAQVEFWRAYGVRVSREQALLWIDNHCRTNPLSNVASGAMSLFDERTGGVRLERTR